MSRQPASIDVLVALGSNLGEPIDNLVVAARRLQSVAVAPVTASSVWCSAPVGFDEPVPDFCNAVVRMATELSPLELLVQLQDIEREMGRMKQQGVGYTSRIIDLDIVDYGGSLVSEPGLTVPHPRAHERLFVLLPLQEVDPDYRFPTQGKDLSELIEAAEQIEISRSIPLNLSA